MRAKSVLLKITQPASTSASVYSRAAQPGSFSSAAPRTYFSRINSAP